MINLLQSSKFAEYSGPMTKNLISTEKMDSIVEDAAGALAGCTQECQVNFDYAAPEPVKVGLQFELKPANK